MGSARCYEVEAGGGILVAGEMWPADSLYTAANSVLAMVNGGKSAPPSMIALFAVRVLGKGIVLDEGQVGNWKDTDKYVARNAETGYNGMDGLRVGAESDRLGNSQDT